MAKQSDNINWLSVGRINYICALITLTMVVVSIFKSAVIIIILLSVSRCGGEEVAGNYYRVDMIRTESAESPLMKSLNLTKPERMRLSLEQSKRRVEMLQAMARGESVYSPLTAGEVGFIMQLGVGSPSKSKSPLVQHVIPDTGSDLIWLQCGPECSVCYKQTDPLYNPHTSPTYKTLSCRSKFCTGSVENFCNPPDTCGYYYSYGDGANTTGDMATETFSLKRMGSGSSGWKALPPLAFGCGHRQEGPTEAGTAGLVGLGRGVLSMPSQLGKSIGYKFSYCLGPVDDDAGVSALFLGDARFPGNFQSTPLVRPEGPNYGRSFYYVELHGISVGGTMIKYPASTFRSGGVIVDSGTTQTALVEPAYNALVGAVRSKVKAPPMKETEPYLCYESSKVRLAKLPRIAFHFAGNATLVVPPRNSFRPIQDAEEGIEAFCFAYGSAGHEGETSILGNILQQNFNIVFDTAKNKLSFAPTLCDEL